MKHRATLIAATVFFTACANLAGSDGARRAGIIESPYLRASVLTAPEAVTAGVPFDVTVTTFGFSGCWTPDGTDVSNLTSQAVIRPYDRVRTEGACTQTTVTLPRSVQLRFDQPGTVTIVVQGVRDDGDNAEPTQIERTVVVR
jgi:hypothetical protein